jgi:hypothetical protein
LAFILIAVNIQYHRLQKKLVARAGELDVRQVFGTNLPRLVRVLADGFMPAGFLGVIF